MQPGSERSSGQAQVARARQAEERAQPSLHRPERVQQVEIGVGDDVGRDGERQQQPDLEEAPARERVGRHEPGRAGADHRHHDADPEGAAPRSAPPPAAARRRGDAARASPEPCSASSASDDRRAEHEPQRASAARAQGSDLGRMPLGSMRRIPRAAIPGRGRRAGIQARRGARTRRRRLGPGSATRPGCRGGCRARGSMPDRGSGRPLTGRSRPCRRGGSRPCGCGRSRRPARCRW